MKNNIFKANSTIDFDLSTISPLQLADGEIKQKCDSTLTLSSNLTGLYLQSYYDRAGLGQIGQFQLDVILADGTISSYPITVSKSVVDTNNLYTYFFNDINIGETGLIKFNLRNDVEGVRTNWYNVVDQSDLDCYIEIKYTIDCDCDSIPFSLNPVTHTFYLDEDSLVGTLNSTIDLEEEETNKETNYTIGRKTVFSRNLTVRNINEFNMKTIIEATGLDSLTINNVSYQTINLTSLEYVGCCIDPMVLELVESINETDNCCEQIVASVNYTSP